MTILLKHGLLAPLYPIDLRESLQHRTISEVPAHNIFHKQLKTFLFSNAYKT